MNASPLLIGAEWISTPHTAQVHNPHTGEPVADFCLAGEPELARALKRGAKLLTDLHPRAADRCLPPILLEGMPEDADLVREEAFGPVALLDRYEDFDEVLARVNRSKYGLQASVFTQDVSLAHRAFERLEVGGVLVNQAPSFRVENMPYGGVKDSGFGREGVRSAMEEMTEPRTLIFNLG